MIFVVISVLGLVAGERGYGIGGVVVFLFLRSPFEGLHGKTCISGSVHCILIIVITRCERRFEDVLRSVMIV